MKTKATSYRYGKCHVCGESMKERRICQDFWIKGRLFVIEDVPAGVCPQCGEKVVTAEVGQRIATLIGRAPRLRRTRTLRVPVVRFAQKVA